MILYHFTSSGHIAHILAWGGLENGDVMVGARGEMTLNATWFTTDPNPAHAGMSDDLTGVEMPSHMVAQGAPPVIMSTADKTELRIKVKISSTDRNLRHWLTFARKRVGQRIIDFEVRSAGGKRNAEHWYFYDGLVPLKRIEAIEVRDHRGIYRVASAEELAAMEPFEVGWSYGVQRHEINDRE